MLLGFEVVKCVQLVLPLRMLERYWNADRTAKCCYRHERRLELCYSKSKNIGDIWAVNGLPLLE